MTDDFVKLNSPPLHPDAPERPKLTSAPIHQFPVYQLEPFQIQRAHALELAIQILPAADVFDLIRAASFIENGRTPD